MGCVSSTLLNQEDEFSHSLGHHIVSLTSTTYGLLSTLDPPNSGPTTTVPPTPPGRFTLGSLFTTSPFSERPPPPEEEEEAEVINSWELMAGLDSTADSFRLLHKENSHPNLSVFHHDGSTAVSKKPLYDSNICNQPQHVSLKSNFEDAPTVQNSGHAVNCCMLDRFEKICPPKGENRVVIYTTTLRSVRRTFEACNAVRAAIQGLGFEVLEKDISMDRRFKEELRELLEGKETSELIPPRVFVRGRYLGGAEEFMRIVEDGCLADLLEGLPKLRAGHVCEGCGDIRFLPCFSCNGSCKVIMAVKDDMRRRNTVVRCLDCNENGLVLCPICS